MKQCPSCGKEVSEDRIICNYCSMPLTYKKEKKTKKERKKINPNIIIGLLIIILITFIIVFLHINKLKKEKDKKIVKEESPIYFSAKLNSQDMIDLIEYNAGYSMYVMNNSVVPSVPKEKCIYKDEKWNDECKDFMEYTLKKDQYIKQPKIVELKINKKGKIEKKAYFIYKKEKCVFNGEIMICK